MHPAIAAYADRYYGRLLAGPREAVSLHLRLGYRGEPAMPLLRDRRFPSAAWLSKVVQSEFGRDQTAFLVFSDNAQLATLLVSQYVEAGYNMTVIDENPAVSLYLMSRCMHHVLTSSSFSFWSAYLDPKQPDGGRTIVPPQFFIDHGRHMIPYSEWEVIDDDDDGDCTEDACE